MEIDHQDKSDNITPSPDEAQDSQFAEEMDVRRNVVVIMPFGSGKNENGAERQSILNLMRIKYIVEKLIKVTATGAEHGSTIKYDVNVFRAPVGAVPENALDSVTGADIVIALLTERNINVIYELAIRNLLKDEPILIVQGDPEEVLPVYLKELAYVSYEHDKSTAVIQQIQRIAADQFPELDWNKPNRIPDGLREAIDASDHLRSEFEEAFERLERQAQRPPAFLRKHVIDLDPGLVLSTWTTYTPYSVVRINWSRRKGPLEYDPTDMIGEPVIYTGNREYMELFDLNVNEFPDPHGDNPLTLSNLLLRIKPYIEPGNFQKFEDDQLRLTQRIVLQDGYDQAEIPLQITDKHPKFANKVLLPCLISKRVIGSTHSPHTTYLLVAFILDFWPIGQGPK